MVRIQRRGNSNKFLLHLSGEGRSRYIPDDTIAVSVAGPMCEQHAAMSNGIITLPHQWLSAPQVGEKIAHLLVLQAVKQPLWHERQSGGLHFADLLTLD